MKAAFKPPLEMHQFLKSNSIYFLNIVLDVVYCFHLALPKCTPRKSN